MAAKFKQITRALDKLGLKYAVQANESIAFLSVGAENVEQIDIVIALEDNGTYLRMVIPNLLMIGDSPLKCLIHQTLLDISYKSSLVRWGYEPMSGEICASVELVLANANLTEQQFCCCLEALVYGVDTVAIPRLQSVLEKGVDPGVEEMGQQLLENLESNLPDGVIDALHNALSDRIAKNFRNLWKQAEQYCQQSFPFEHPFYWASFISQGIG